MASITSNPLSLSSSSSSTLIDVKAPRQSAAASSQCVTLPTLPPSLALSQSRPRKTTASCQKIAGNVVAMATAEAPAEVAATELPDIVRTVQEAWDKVEEKYAVSSLAVAGVVALWGSTGMISAIDRLPFIPGVLELVGIGYTGVQAPFMFGLTKALLSTDLNHPIDDDHDFKRIKSLVCLSKPDLQTRQGSLDTKNQGHIQQHTWEQLKGNRWKCCLLKQVEVLVAEAYILQLCMKCGHASFLFVLASNHTKAMLCTFFLEHSCIYLCIIFPPSLALSIAPVYLVT